MRGDRDEAGEARGSSSTTTRLATPDRRARAIGKLPQLKKLELEHNQVGDAGAMIRRSRSELFLFNNQIGDAGVAALCRGGGQAVAARLIRNRYHTRQAKAALKAALPNCSVY